MFCRSLQFSEEHIYSNAPPTRAEMCQQHEARRKFKAILSKVIYISAVTSMSETFTQYLIHVLEADPDQDHKPKSISRIKAARHTRNVRVCFGYFQCFLASVHLRS